MDKGKARLSLLCCFVGFVVTVNCKWQGKVCYEIFEEWPRVLVIIDEVCWLPSNGSEQNPF